MPEVISAALPAEEPSAWSCVRAQGLVNKRFLIFLDLGAWLCLLISKLHVRRERNHHDGKKKTYRHFIERLCARVTVEEGLVLHPEAIDTERCKSGLVLGAGHGWILDDELGLACVDVDLPDACQ